ncbi:MAG: sulfatase-like hydrolase/transferase, partial [Cyclobacteriaceae bacterium]
MIYQQYLKKFTWINIILFILVVLNGCIHAKQPEKQISKPNLVLIFLDDGAFNDFKPFGEPRYPTPNVATLAEEGTSYYSFYVPQAVCSASRSALLTGCYPGRTKVFGAYPPR